MLFRLKQRALRFSSDPRFTAPVPPATRRASARQSRLNRLLQALKDDRCEERSETFSYFASLTLRGVDLVTGHIEPGDASLGTSLRFLITGFFRFLLAGEEHHVPGGNIEVVVATLVEVEFWHPLTMNDALKDLELINNHQLL